MAGKTREIKGRMKAVGNIQRITKTMQMIATARFQAMQRRATQAQAYSRKLAEVIGELAGALGSSEQASHPLLSPPEQKTGRELLLIITSNRGLAGAYNANVLRAATRYLREHGGHERFDLEVVGKKGLAFLKFTRLPVSRAHTQFGDTPAYEEVERLAKRFMDEFRAGKYDAIRVVSMQFISMSRQVPAVNTLLPMEKPAETPGADPTAHHGSTSGGATSGGSGGAMAQYEFLPSAQELLDELVPMAVKTRLFQFFNEAVVSEQLARMVAMKAATDAAGKMKKDLSRRYNRARQASITTELTEIIGGAAALE
jgi:F-type H+-transporting ATPase subunit gamma